MKSIEKLGITPYPWNVDLHTVVANDGRELIDYDLDFYRDEDAALVSAAPELYESLEEAQREVCFKCHGSEVPRGDEGCDQCIVAGWIDAMKKAGGAE